MQNTLYPNRQRRHGDRYDAFRIRKVDPLFAVIPHLMIPRIGSLVYFEEDVEIARLEQFVRRLRKETEMTDLSVLHVVTAATVRLLAQYPGLNRFISGRKLFARDHISLSMAVKQNMSLEGAETTIKTAFGPTDALPEVWRKVHGELASVKESANNNTFETAAVFQRLPVWLVKFTVFVLRNLDEVGMMPKVIHEASPFHASTFLVDIGSTGIDSIYHHLYDFGTCSEFISIGRKKMKAVADRDGTIRPAKVITFKFVIDERICDGYYYAKAFAQFKRYLRHPEMLLESIEAAASDPQL